MGIFNQRNDTITIEGQILPESYNAPRALVASAVKLNMRDKVEMERVKKRLETSTWQQEAWDYYDYIGEVKYASNLVANVLSRINLYVAYVEDTSRVPVPIDSCKEIDPEYATLAKDVLALLESGDGGTSGLLRDSALNMFITGEFYLVREPARPSLGIPEKWQIRSVDEILVIDKGKAKGIYIQESRDCLPQDRIRLPDNAFVARMWRRHPRYSAEADSSMRGVLEDCDDLLLFSREARAVSRSRIGAGMLFLPDGIDNAAMSDSDDDEEGDASDDAGETLIEEMIEAFSQPVLDEGHANSLVPLVIRGPVELGEKIRHIQFERTIDPMHAQQVEDKLERILQALDIPKDIAKGLSGVKYSNAILIEESLYKAHIEPLILMIVDSFTNGFLRQALRAMARERGLDENVIDRTVIWYDPSAITAKPSKAEAANFGVENDILSGAAWRMANGFNEADAPDENELARKLVSEKVMLNDQVSEKLLALVLPTLMDQIRAQSMAVSDPNSASALNQALGAETIDPATGLPQTQAATGLIEPDGAGTPAPAGAGATPTGTSPGLIEP